MSHSCSSWRAAVSTRWLLPGAEGSAPFSTLCLTQRRSLFRHTIAMSSLGSLPNWLTPCALLGPHLQKRLAYESYSLGILCTVALHHHLPVDDVTASGEGPPEERLHIPSRWQESDLTLVAQLSGRRCQVMSAVHCALEIHQVVSLHSTEAHCPRQGSTAANLHPPRVRAQL
jgi:hypothetical protein